MPSALAVFTTSTYASPSSDTSASAPNPIHHESRDHASTASCDARPMRGGGRHAARQISSRNSIKATRPPMPTISTHRALTAQTDVSAGPLAPPAPPRYGAPMGTSPTANTAAPPTMWPSADTTRHCVVYVAAGRLRVSGMMSRCELPAGTCAEPRTTDSPVAVTTEASVGESNWMASEKVICTSAGDRSIRWRSSGAIFSTTACAMAAGVHASVDPTSIARRAMMSARARGRDRTRLPAYRRSAITGALG